MVPGCGTSTWKLYNYIYSGTSDKGPSEIRTTSLQRPAGDVDSWSQTMLISSENNSFRNEYRSFSREFCLYTLLGILLRNCRPRAPSERSIINRCKPLLQHSYTMDSSSSSEGHAFGQEQPPLYVTIQKILDKYPDGQIFKVCRGVASDGRAGNTKKNTASYAWFKPRFKRRRPANC